MEAKGGSVQFAGGTLGEKRHICAFFNSIDEEHRVLHSFFKDGFDRGEKALHLVDAELREEHLKRFARAGINTQQALDSGQLEMWSWQEAYLRENRFNQETTLAFIEEMLKSAAAAGYPLARLVGHHWALLDKPGVEDFLEFETRLNYVLPKYSDIVLCAYSLSEYGASMVMDVLRTHPVAIIGGVLQENPFFVPPDQLLLEMKERRSVGKSAGMPKCA